MRRATTLSSILSEEKCSYFFEKYKNFVPTGFSSWLRERGLQLVFRPDSPELQEAIEEIRQCGGTPYLFSRVYYTKKELENVPFFSVLVFDPLELEGTTVADYGTQYLDKCPECGLCETLAGDVLVDRKFIKRYRIGTLPPHYFVSAEVRAMIEAAGLTGVSFSHEVRDYKGRDMPQYYIMTVHNVLPPLSISSWLNYTDGRKEPCGHNVVYLRSDMQYEKEKLNNAKDINLTCERLYNPRIRCLVISAKAKELFARERLNMRYEPVLLL